MSIATYIGEESSVQRPSSTSSGPRWNGLKRAASETRRQNVSSAVPRARRPRLGIAVDQHRGIHRARRRAGDAVDLEPRLLEQPVEHAPGEGAVRAAALQREIDEDGIAGDRGLGSPVPWASNLAEIVGPAITISIVFKPIKPRCHALYRFLRAAQSRRAACVAMDFAAVAANFGMSGQWI